MYSLVHRRKGQRVGVDTQLWREYSYLEGIEDREKERKRERGGGSARGAVAGKAARGRNSRHHQIWVTLRSIPI